VAVAYSRGSLPTAAVPGFKETMRPLAERVIGWARRAESA